MKAFALTKPGILGWAEIPDDRLPGPGEVVVHPVACGICASDIHYWRFGRIGDQVIRNYPYALGHECAGVIVEVGPGVTNVRPGQRVAVEPGLTCGKCAPCKEGRENICPNVEFLGTPPHHGALRETILTSHRNVEPMPDSLSFEAAALCEPLGVGIHAARLAGVSEGESVAIFGAGAIGLSTAIAVRLRGAARIIFAEPLRERRQLAESMGFETIDIDADPAGQLHEMTRGGVHVAFEAAGEPQAITWTIAAVRPGGRAAIIGIPAENTATFDVQKLRRGELTLYSCRRSNRTLADAINIITGPGADAARMCTHRFPVSESARAFQMMSSCTNGVIRAMLMLDER